MELFSADVLNAIADLEEERMRNEAKEEEMFHQAIQRWEFEAVMDEMFGG